MATNGTTKYVENGSFIEPFISYREAKRQAATGTLDSAKAFKKSFAEDQNEL